jgi:hypothetical protein
MDEERKARQIYTSTIYSTSGLFGLGAWGWYYLTTTSTSTSTSTTTVSRFTGQAGHIEISKQIFPEKEYRGFSPNFHIHASVSDLYIPTISLPILLEEICRLILGLYKSLTRNVEIGAEAALFPEKEYINGIFVAV